MNYEDFLRETTALVQNLSDQGKVTEVLTRLGDAYKTLYENHSSLTQQSATLTQQIDTLKQQNMNLFLRVGNPVTDPKLNDTNDKPMSYEDLIKNEFGVEV
jgi:hypothetical protein